MSKILVDKSGIPEQEKPKSKKGTQKEASKDVRTRIRDIHITDEPTVQEFIQPIAPNLRRTKAVQLKQIGGPSAEELRLELEKGMAKLVKELMELDIRLTPSQRTELSTLAKSLPDISNASIVQKAFKGDIVGVIKELKAKAAKEAKALKAKEAKRTKKIKTNIKGVDDTLKDLIKKINQEKNIPKGTSEKGKPVNP